MSRWRTVAHEIARFRQGGGYGCVYLIDSAMIGRSLAVAGVEALRFRS